MVQQPRLLAQQPAQILHVGRQTASSGRKIVSFTDTTQAGNPHADRSTIAAKYSTVPRPLEYYVKGSSRKHQLFKSSVYAGRCTPELLAGSRICVRSAAWLRGITLMPTR